MATMNIIKVLTTIGLKWIVNYSYYGEFLVDFIRSMLHHRIASITLRIRLYSITTNDSRIEHWFRFAFKFDIMMSLHGVNFVKSYLHIMKYGATNGSLQAN